jgi:hypothetical protein
MKVFGEGGVLKRIRRLMGWVRGRVLGGDGTVFILPYLSLRLMGRG